MAVVVEMLPGVTGGEVYVRFESFEFFLIVNVEVEQGVALEFVPFVESSGTCGVVHDELVVGPSGYGVSVGGAVAEVTRHLVTYVEVEVQFGEEVQGVVDLEVAG